MLKLDSTFYFNVKATNLTFVDCDFGEATFNDRGAAAFASSGGSNGNLAGTIFGEGSLNMVVALLALVVSVASIGINVAANKKKGCSALKENEQ